MKRIEIVYEIHIKVKESQRNILQIAFYYSYIDRNFKHNASYIV